MTDINSILIIGRLVRTPEITYTQSGVACTNFSIAVNRSVKQGNGWTDKVSFFDCALFGKQAENLTPYLAKGKQVAIDGFIEQQRWEKNGNHFSKVVIIVDTIQLLGGRDNESQKNAEPEKNNSDSSEVSMETFPEYEYIPF